MIARSSEEVKEFLVALEKLCSDHGMVIWVCYRDWEKHHTEKYIGLWLVENASGIIGEL